MLLPHLNPSIPVVSICNISEAFISFLSRAEDAAERQSLILGEQYRADRTLIWVGEPKLAIVSFRIPHEQRLFDQLGYQSTVCLAPAQATAYLCTDIINDPALLAAIVAYAGEGRTVQLVPYANTPEFYTLVDILQHKHNLTVLLPESPKPETLWIKDYLDTKTGFHALASRWLPDADVLLPKAIICTDIDETLPIIRWFLINDNGCIVKADGGENGVGNRVFDDINISDEEILSTLRNDPFIRDDRLVVEELIRSSDVISPSLEFFVPHLETGKPVITYVCNQLFHEFGDFCGVVTSKELHQKGWYEPLARGGLQIAYKLQEFGYVGHFDLDAIVNDEGRIYLLEINTRRTGGTHVHDFGYTFFGADYIDKVAILSNDGMNSGSLTTDDEVWAMIDDLLYPINGEQRGVVLTGTTALADHQYGVVIIGKSIADVVAIQRALAQRTN